MDRRSPVPWCLSADDGGPSAELLPLLQTSVIENETRRKKKGKTKKEEGEKKKKKKKPTGADTDNRKVVLPQSSNGSQGQLWFNYRAERQTVLS